MLTVNAQALNSIQTLQLLMTIATMHNLLEDRLTRIVITLSLRLIGFKAVTPGEMPLSMVAQPPNETRDVRQRRATVANYQIQCRK